MSDHDIAVNWLQNCRDVIAFGSGSRRAASTFWAYEKLDELCSKDPFRALKIVREILELKPEERVTANLAAGPMEDLLVRHGSAMLPHIKRYAREDHEFFVLLEYVWLERMAPEVQPALRAFFIL